MTFRRRWVDPFGAPKSLPILNLSNFVKKKKGFPGVKKSNNNGGSIRRVHHQVLVFEEMVEARFVRDARGPSWC